MRLSTTKYCIFSNSKKISPTNNFFFFSKGFSDNYNTDTIKFCLSPYLDHTTPVNNYKWIGLNRALLKPPILLKDSFLFLANARQTLYVWTNPEQRISTQAL